MKIKVSADMTADITPELLAKHNITQQYLPISLGDKEYLDGVDITPQTIYEHFDKTGQLPKTAAPNPVVVREFYEKTLAEDGGYDALIHFTISSDLSVTYNNSVMAAEGLPVYVVDSRSLSSGITLQVLYACDLVAEGKLSAEEIFNKVVARRDHVQASFVIGNMKFLHKGGRCSGVAAFGANLLGIKPSIELRDGRMEVGKKFRGKAKDVLAEYIKYTLDTQNKPDKRRVFVTHTLMEAGLTEHAVDLVKGKFDELIENTAGCTITSHCGKGTLGILYYNDAD